MCRYKWYTDDWKVMHLLFQSQVYLQQHVSSGLDKWQSMVETKVFTKEGDSLAFLLGSVLLAILLIQPACFAADSPNVVVVQPGQSIAQAVGIASVGDIVFVKNGIYVESGIIVNKSLSIVGESTENTVIDGGSTIQVIFQILADDVTLENLTLRNTSPDPFAQAPAIRIFNVADVKVRNITIVNAAVGVELRSSNLTQVLRCRISGCTSSGVYLRDKSCDNLIVGNTIANSSIGIRFADAASQGNRIYHGSFENNTQQVLSVGGTNFFDNGYPSGGNHWDNDVSVDVKSGPSQNQEGSDGIFDQGFGFDNYPLANPLASVNINLAGQEFFVEVSSNFEIMSWDLNVSEKSLHLFVTAPQGTVSEARVNIPKGMLSCESLNAWDVSYVDGDVRTLQYLGMEDALATYLHFTSLSTEPGEIRIVGTKVLPEFGPLTIMAVFLLLTAVAGILFKRYPSRG